MAEAEARSTDADEVWTKDPSARLDFGVDWTEWMGESEPIIDGDALESSSWTAEPAGGILVEDGGFDDGGLTRVWISGGAIGSRYVVANHITTSGGRSDSRRITLTVFKR